MTREEIDELIQLLQKYELSIAALYETLASVLPQSEARWMKMAKEERLHAKWIGELHDHLDHENISFEATKLTAQSARTAIRYIAGQTDKMGKNAPDLVGALNLAIDVEKSLLESSLLRVFVLHGPKAQQIQTRLEAATRAHVDQLIEWRSHARGS